MSCSFDLVFFSVLVHSVLKPVLISNDHSTFTAHVMGSEKKLCTESWVCMRQPSNSY